MVLCQFRATDILSTPCALYGGILALLVVGGHSFQFEDHLAAPGFVLTLHLEGEDQATHAEDRGTAGRERTSALRTGGRTRNLKKNKENG